MRIVGAPHQGLDAHLVDQLGAHAVVLERRLALPPPVLAGLQLERQVLVLVLVLEIHAVEHVRDPADAALAEGDADVRIALEHGPAHQSGQDVRQRHLEQAQAAVHQRALGEARVLLPQRRRHRGERVEVQRDSDLVDGRPQWLPLRMPHRLHVPRARQLETLEAELGGAMNLGDGGVDVTVRQVREPDVAVGILAAEIRHPRVVDAQHLVRGLDVLQLGRRREDAVNHLGVDAVAIHLLDTQVRIARPANPLLAVVVQPGRRHHVDAQLLARDVLGAGRANAAGDPELDAVLRDPPPLVGPVGHVRHAVLQVRRRLRREQVGGKPDQVEVTVGGDPVVGHDVSSLPSSDSAVESYHARGTCTVVASSPEPARS